MRRAFVSWAMAMGILLTGVLVARSLADSSPSGAINGIWKVAMTPDPANTAVETGFSDKLIFQDGLFKSRKLEHYGFAAAAYTLTGDKAFAAKQTSKTDGTAQWAGQIAADGDMTGSLVWSKSDGVVAKFTFSGSPVSMAPIGAQPTP